MIVGLHDDLAGAATFVSNRLRGRLLLDAAPQKPDAVAWSVGRTRRHRRMDGHLVAGIFTSLGEQTVVVPGMGTAA